MNVTSVPFFVDSINSGKIRGKPIYEEEAFLSDSSLSAKSEHLWSEGITSLPAVKPYSLQKRSNFLRRIPEEEWQQAIQWMEKEGLSASLDELRAFQKGFWKHSVFQNPNWILIAFQAYLEERLDMETMCRLFLYYACLKEDLRTFQLLDEGGNCDPEAWEALRRATRDYLNDEQLTHLHQALAMLPPEETQFFSVHRQMDGLLKAIVGVGLQWPQFTLGIMGEPKLDQTREWCVEQMIAPPALIYQIHRARFGENAIRPLPSLGFSHQENLSDPFARVVSIPSFFSLPDNLHKHKAAALTVYHHDVAYHHAVESGNSHRLFWIKFAFYLQKESLKPASKISQEIVEHTWDRDLGSYLRNRNESESINFWLALASYCCNLSRRQLYSDAILDCFLACYRENPELVRKYGLSVESLKRSWTLSNLRGGNYQILKMIERFSSELISDTEII